MITPEAKSGAGRLDGVSGLPTFVPFVAMWAGVLVVYLPPALLGGDSTLYGMDFWALHLRRIQFVHESVSALSIGLPGWYPRELFGSPFWANLQNFPWIPTRLCLLLLEPELAYAAGVNLAAGLAATFTFAYGRAIGWSPIAAALAGWTFAGAGFFAARVTAGHLPLLEAYPALPFLLWLVERSFRNGNRARHLAALAAGVACVVVAGHPQLPAYAVFCATSYLVWVGWRRYAPSRRPICESVLAIGMGAAATLAVWWPMLALLGRSTRTLPLARAPNDLALPYARLPALLLPWRDGWPAAVHRFPAEPFTGFPRPSYFWDTVGYVGIAPWIAALAIVLLWLRGSRPIPRRAAFFAALGPAALVLALPWVQEVGALVPGTWLRSPARLLYLTTFVLSLAAGAVLDRLLRARWPRGPNARLLLVAGIALLHVLDLAAHDRCFVRTRPRALREMPAARIAFEEQLDGARVAVDHNLSLGLNRRFDDVGFFDSIILARPYTALLALAGLSPETNVQSFKGSTLSAAALSNLGAAFVVSPRVRRDLPRIVGGRDNLYRVPNPTPRALFFAWGETRFLSESEILERLRRPGLDLAAELMLPAAERRPDPGPSPEVEGARVDYARPAPDRISIAVDAPRAGFVRVLESCDPGWSASVDGAPTAVLCAETFLLAVEVAPGAHRVAFEYRTPGAMAGASMSLASLLLLGALLWSVRRGSASR